MTTKHILSAAVTAIALSIAVPAVAQPGDTGAQYQGGTSNDDDDDSSKWGLLGLLGFAGLLGLKRRRDEAPGLRTSAAVGR